MCDVYWQFKSNRFDLHSCTLYTVQCSFYYTRTMLNTLVLSMYSTLLTFFAVVHRCQCKFQMRLLNRYISNTNAIYSGIYIYICILYNTITSTNVSVCCNVVRGTNQMLSVWLRHISICNCQIRSFIMSFSRCASSHRFIRLTSTYAYVL